MFKVMTLPGRYIQGYGLIKEFGRYVASLGTRPFIFGGKRALSAIRENIEQSARDNGLTCEFALFTGKGTQSDAKNLTDQAREFNADMIVGVGGGLALDTAKAVVYDMNLPLVLIPTIASTDAPCSAEALQYTEDHQIDRILVLKRNPDLILVDSKVIAEAPARFFVAGMGDALATWFEAHSCARTGAQNFSGGIATEMALAVARLTYDILMKHGIKAKMAVDRNIVTPAVELVIEANALLSSIGFENCGLGAAHSVNVGLSSLKGAQKCLHGELVGFGVIANLILENYPKEEIGNVLDFCAAVGLPLTLKELGLADVTDSQLLQAAEVSLTKESNMHNLAMEITPEMVRDAIIMADILGRKVLSK